MNSGLPPCLKLTVQIYTVMLKVSIFYIQTQASVTHIGRIENLWSLSIRQTLLLDLGS